MTYVDGFVIPIPKKNIDAYKHIAKIAGKVWRDHGALDYKECVIEDPKAPKMVRFTQMVDVKRGETVLFSFIVYKSRAHRDKVNKKVMADERMLKMMDDKDHPFDYTRMAYGGFMTIVE